ncbi:hypothetical protein MUP01_00745, partial [Candidatus Bathyarchaeota archaeon]|nr:hypothetical protein [Candidatus Bathyarchaeota archaeon]
STTFTGILVTGISAAIIRNNTTNAATIIGYQATTADASTMTEHEVIPISGDYDARCRDEIISVDATAATRTIALPEKTNRDLIGHQIEVFRAAGTNQIALTVRSADGTINGGTTILLPIELYSRAICRNLGTGNWDVTILRPSVNPSFFTLSDLATTPNVKNMTHFWASSSVATSIIRFDNGDLGQVITVVATNGNTTLKNGATIINRSAGDYAMAANSARRYICIDAAVATACVWTEI